MGDRLDVAVLVTANLEEMIVCTVLADEDTQLNDDVSSLILEASDTELVKWILEHLFKEILDNLRLLESASRYKRQFLLLLLNNYTVHNLLTLLDLFVVHYN